MRNEAHLVKLRSTQQLDIGKRYAHAAAQIACDIDERRTLVCLGRRKFAIGNHIDGKKEERQTYRLQDSYRSKKLKLASGGRDVEYHIAAPTVANPNAIQYFGCIRPITWPAIGIEHSITRPPGIMARPESSAV